MTAPEHLLGGRYELGELLGYGGMAEVHRGRDHRLGRDVAIKMLRTDLARDQTFQLRFRKEAQNVATLNHPGIAAVYDTGETEGAGGEALPYIVMEYVNGRTLKDVLLEEGRLQPRRALEVSADICAALEFSHRHGIIHRDVKPGNVMTTGNGQIKVMDFGIARDLASGTSTMTQTSAVIGTAQYLSPEQARGEAVDARSDVYAAGCLLYELLCGHPPFTGDSPVAVAYQHVREDPRPPSTLNPELGPDIDAVVLKALAKNPVNRYQSAAEMRADLLRAAAGRPVLATPVLTSDETVLLGPPGAEPARVGDPGRRRASTWVLVALAVLGVLAVIALIIGLILASQTRQVAVPDVLGLTEEDAVAAIEAEGLAAAAGDPVPAGDCGDFEEDEVARQSPEPGGSVDEGGAVTYHLCAPPEAFPLPDVVGSTRAQAVSRLEALDLVVTVEFEDSEQPPDTVLRTDPAADATVRPGDRVVLHVSEGNLAPVPDVVGLTEDEARGRLAAFTVAVEDADSDPSELAEVGRVASQRPAGGDEEFAQRGSTVTIFVYRDTPLVVETPTVDGLTVSVTWDNGVYGGVTIDWGDGSPPEQFGAAAGTRERTYTVDPGAVEDFTITVTATDHPGRSQSHTVTIDNS